MKKDNKISIGISIIFLIIAFVLENLYNWNVCNTGFCHYELTEIANTFALFGIVALVFSVILLFMKEQIFTAWWRFARWYLLGSAILIAITPVGPSGGIISIDAELVSWFLASFFFIISLVIIVWSAIKAKRSS